MRRERARWTRRRPGRATFFFDVGQPATRTRCAGSFRFFHERAQRFWLSCARPLQGPNFSRCFLLVSRDEIRNASAAATRDARCLVAPRATSRARRRARRRSLGAGIARGRPRIRARRVASNAPREPRSSSSCLRAKGDVHE
eukprot:8930-Pelagococcus_subviridis.AAC.2